MIVIAEPMGQPVDFELQINAKGRLISVPHVETIARGREELRRVVRARAGVE